MRLHPAPIATAVLAAAAAAVAAGCDTAVELTFTSPVAGEEIDTSCVNAVEVTMFGPGEFDVQTTCIEVTPGRVKSLANHNLSGLFDAPLPPWKITAVQVRGVAAPAGCTFDEAVGPTIFVASTADADGDTIALPLRGVVSCADKIDAPPVRAVDLTALIADGTCVATEGLLVEPGAIFPSTLEGADAGWMNYTWAPGVAVAADGLVTLPYSFSKAVTGSCVSLLADDGVAEIVHGCLTPAGRGACGPEPEFHYLPINAVSATSLTAEEAISRSVVVFGLVVDRALAPIPGATITATNPDAVIHYTDPNPAGDGFVTAGGSGTTAAGTFTVLSNQPVLLEVSAPGKDVRRVMATGYGGTVVVMENLPL